MDRSKGILDYSHRICLDLPYEEAVARTTDALRKQGFGLLTEVDVTATLKQKLGLDFRKYTILGVCNPFLAYEALRIEVESGLLLPCNVIVYEEGEGSVVAITDPASMLRMVENRELEALAQHTHRRLHRVIETLGGVQQSASATEEQCYEETQA